MKLSIKINGEDITTSNASNLVYLSYKYSEKVEVTKTKGNVRVKKVAIKMQEQEYKNGVITKKESSSEKTSITLLD